MLLGQDKAWGAALTLAMALLSKRIIRRCSTAQQAAIVPHWHQQRIIREGMKQNELESQIKKSYNGGERGGIIRYMHK